MDNPKNTKTSKEVVKKETETNPVTNLLSFRSLDEAMVMCDKLAKSNFNPLKKAEDVLAAILMGKELGIGQMMALNNIYIVDGKGSIGYHVANALILKAGIHYEIEKDSLPVYEYYDVLNKGAKYTFDELIEIKNVTGQEYRIVAFAGSKEQQSTQLNKYIKETPDKILIIKHKTDDLECIINFTRTYKDGRTPMKLRQVYRLSDLPVTYMEKRDNWKGHTRVMLTNRTTLVGSRRIGGDILHGMLETTELLDFKEIPYTIDDEGAVTIQDKNGNQVHKVETRIDIDKSDVDREVIVDETETETTTKD